MTNEAIMVVEDDVLIAENIKNTLQGFGYSVPAMASRGELAIERAGSVRPDLVLMDIRLAGEMDGIAAAERIKADYGIPVIYLTAYADEELFARAKVTEPYGYLVKPFHNRDLHATVQMALYKHEMDRRLKESEERCHAVMSQALDGIVLFEPSTREILGSNYSFRAMLGYAEEDADRPAIGDIAGNDLEGFERDIRQVMADKRLTLGERRFRRKDGSLIDVWVSAVVIRAGDRDIVSMALHDLSEQKRAEEQKRLMEARLHYGQKMESLGTMAGAVAHTFNNILSVILGNAEMLRTSLPEDLIDNEMLQAITTSGTRAAGIVKQIVAYTGHVQMRPERIDLSRLIMEMAPLMEAAVPKEIDLSWELPDSLPPVLVDVNQVRQAVMNLFTNAVEAIGEENGVITLGVKIVQADDSLLNEPHLSKDLPERSSYAVLEITDTGSGMDEAVMSRIFDPFFSTKFMGRGLGLSATLGIVRHSRGIIKVFSRKGEGARVLLGFPVEER